VDNRLRGLDPSQIAPVRGEGLYDMTAQRYAVTQGDPYEQEAQRQRDLGQRMPLPYQFPSALAGMPSLTGVAPQDQAYYENMHSDHAANPAGAVAGQRQTHWGSFGARTDTSGGPWNDARRRFGYGQMGSRDAGYSDEWDTPLARERTAGRLTQTQSFDQEVMPHRPYLHLRAGGVSVQAEGRYVGNALMRVTAGNFEHGGTQIRQFWVGGGLVAAFDLKGWDNVRIELLELMDDTFVEFAWSTEGLADNMSSTLMFPQIYTTAATSSPTPQGAYALQIEEPAGGGPVVLEWTGQVGGAVFTFSETVGDPTASQLYFGQMIPVKAPTFRIDTSTDIVWALRPI
jgi:hypothetical protein